MKRRIKQGPDILFFSNWARKFKQQEFPQYSLSARKMTKLLKQQLLQSVQHRWFILSQPVWLPELCSYENILYHLSYGEKTIQQPKLQSMACAHRRYSPPKTVAHQVYLGVANQMGVIGCGPTKSFNKTSRSELLKKQTFILILHSWWIGLVQGRSWSCAFVIIQIAKILTALGKKLVSAHQKLLVHTGTP